MGLGGLVRSITKPIQSVASSISDIPGSIKGFVQNPIKSIGEGIGNAYMLPGRALGSDALTNLGGGLGALTGGILGGPNMGKAAGAASGNQGLGQMAGRGAVGTAGLLGALYGGSALMGGGAGAGSGGGTITASGAAPGGALMSAGSQAAPAIGALDAGAGALTGAAASGSAVPAFGGMAGSAAPSIYSSVPASSSFLGSLGGIGDKITSGLGNMGLKDWLGVGDLAGRLWQSNELNNIAEEAANRGDALQQPQRIPYQQLLSDYLTGGQDITEQPYVKSNMDFAMKQAHANMAKKGTTGAGGAERELMDYANQAYNATALPYLQQLSGMAGFGFGPGYSGNLYGQYASQATGAPFAGLNELGRMFGYNQAINPWQQKANNAQYQMTGRGPGFVD